MFHKIELRERNSDWRGAEKLIPAALAADRDLVDIQFLPQHLAEAASIELRIGNVARAREYLSQANDVVEAALARAPSASIERSLIATMNSVFMERFKLALNNDLNLTKALEILEDGRSRVIAGHLRSAAPESQFRTARTDELNAEIARIQLSLISSAHTPTDRGRLLRALDEAEAELEAVQFSQTPTFHALRSLPVPLRSIQSSLSADELLIEYAVSDQESFVLAVTRESARSYKLAKSADIAALVAAYSKEVSRPNPSV
jgi:hypothetical protein